MEEINTIRCNRIVGRPEKDSEIYIEDYVKSYISRLSQDNLDKGNIDILFGKCRTDGKKLQLDINGAAALTSVERTGKCDGCLEKEIESLNIKYFPELEPVGWFYNREISSGKVDYAELLNIHEELLGENAGILILPNSGSSDPDIYSYSGDGFRKHRGYVIYYEKNPEMQEYLLSNSKRQKEILPGRDVTSSLREKINSGNAIKQRIVSLPGKVKDIYKENVFSATADIQGRTIGGEKKKSLVSAKAEGLETDKTEQMSGEKFSVKAGLTMVGVLSIILAGLLMAFKNNYYTNVEDTIESVREFIRYYAGEDGFAFAKWEIYDIIGILVRDIAGLM